MAVKSAREWRKQTNRRLKIGDDHPGHGPPGWNKAADYLGLKMVMTPVGEDYRADVRAMKERLPEHDHPRGNGRDLSHE